MGVTKLIPKLHQPKAQISATPKRHYCHSNCDDVTPPTNPEMLHRRCIYDVQTPASRKYYLFKK